MQIAPRNNETATKLLTADTPLRIGFFSDFYLPVVSGIATSLQLLAKYLRLAGHHVTIFAPKFPGYLDSESIVYRIPSLQYLDKPKVYVGILGTPRTTLALKRSEFDILHVHSPLSLGIMAYVTARAKGIPLVYTYHTSITDYTHYLKILGRTRSVRSVARWFSTTTTNLSDRVVVPSAKYKRLLERQKVHRPIHLIPNGIDLNSFHNPKEHGVLRQQLGISSETKILIYMGRLDPEKRVDLVVESFGKIAKELTDVHLVLAGDGSSRPKLEAQAAASEQNERIHFLGMVNRTDLPNILHDSTIFITASTSEVHPISVIEAIASGLPMIVAQDEAYEGMVVDNVNGYVVSQDAGVISSKIKEMLAKPEIIQKFGQNSFELSQKYSIESQVNTLTQLYCQMVDEKRSGSFNIDPTKTMDYESDFLRK